MAMNTQIAASAKPIKLTRPKRAVFAMLMVVLLVASVPYLPVSPFTSAA